MSIQADQLYNAVTADPAFATAAAKWSSCMAERGFRYRTPEDLWNRLAGKIARKPTLAMRGLEIRVSVADYHCAAAVALVQTVRALQNKHASSLSRTFAENLATITRIETRAFRVAKALHLPS